jgi:CheY-like chemotaxis protein
MTPTEAGNAHRVLLVDDDSAVLAMMSQGLERKGFEVVAASTVTEALRRIATESLTCSSRTSTCLTQATVLQ